MANALSGIEALASEVAEARAILAKKADLESAIVQAEKRLSRAESSLAEKEAAIEQADSQYKDISSRFEHEKRRYSLDLDSHKAKCAEDKKVASEESKTAMVKANADLTEYVRHAEAVKNAMTAELEKLRSEKDSLRVALSDFKRRIAVLG